MACFHLQNKNNTSGQRKCYDVLLCSSSHCLYQPLKGVSIIIRLCVYKLACLSVCLSTLHVCHLSVCLSTCLYVCLLVCRLVYLLVHLCLSVICLLVCLSIHMAVCPSICLLAHLSVCLYPTDVCHFICLPVSPSVILLTGCVHVLKLQTTVVGLICSQLQFLATELANCLIIKLPPSCTLTLINTITHRNLHDSNSSD